MIISLNLDILISLMLSFTIFLFSIWFFVLRGTPKAHFLRKIGGGYQLIKTKSFKLKTATIKYVDMLYDLDLEQAIRWKKGKPHIFFDIDNASPLSYKTIDVKRNAKMFNILTDNKIITGMFGKQTEKILIIIIMVLVLALMISVSFNTYLVQNPEQFMKIVENTTIVNNRISPIIP